MFANLGKVFVSRLNAVPLDEGCPAKSSCATLLTANLIGHIAPAISARTAADAFCALPNTSGLLDWSAP